MGIRIVLGASVVLVAFACAAAGCVDTVGAMTDYLGRTQDLRDEYRSGASDASANADAGAFSGVYFVECLSPLGGGDLNRTLRFKGTVGFNATAAGTGPITLQLHALRIASTTTATTVGDAFPNAPGAAGTVNGGKFLIDVGDTPDLPKESNPLTGLDWGISALAFRGTLTNPPESFCARRWRRSRPSGVDAAGTICLFQRVESDTQEKLPRVAADFTCPE